MPGFLSFTISESLHKLMSIESMMPYNHLILCHPLLLLVFSSIRVFSKELALCIRRSKRRSFFYNPMNVDNLFSSSSAFSKSSLYIWNFSVHLLLKTSLKDFEDYLASMWNEHDCMVYWTFFGITLLWDWNENGFFPVLWPLLFSKFAGTLSAGLLQHHLLGFEIAQLEFHHLH